MGAVFASTARAPLTSLASVVEMTGDYTLTLPVMLAVAIATVVSRTLSYGTIYTTELLRRGTDIDRAPSADPFEDLTAADAMRPFQPPLMAQPATQELAGSPGEDVVSLPGPVAHQRHLQVLFANECLAQALRQLVLFGGDGLPVLSTDAEHLQGWITSANVLQAIARHINAAQAAAAQTRLGDERALPDPPAATHDAATPLHGYQILEVTIAGESPVAGHALGETSWPPGVVPVSVLDNHTLRDADPGLTLTPGDRINLLVATPKHSPDPPQPDDIPCTQPDPNGDQSGRPSGKQS